VDGLRVGCRGRGLAFGEDTVTRCVGRLLKIAFCGLPSKGILISWQCEHCHSCSQLQYNKEASLDLMQLAVE